MAAPNPHCPRLAAAGSLRQQQAEPEVRGSAASLRASGEEGRGQGLRLGCSRRTWETARTVLLLEFQGGIPTKSESSPRGGSHQHPRLPLPPGLHGAWELGWGSALLGAVVQLGTGFFLVTVKFFRASGCKVLQALVLWGGASTGSSLSSWIMFHCTPKIRSVYKRCETCTAVDGKQKLSFAPAGLHRQTTPSHKDPS